jgi:hypothetical protein
MAMKPPNIGEPGNPTVRGGKGRGKGKGKGRRLVRKRSWECLVIPSIHSLLLVDNRYFLLSKKPFETRENTEEGWGKSGERKRQAAGTTQDWECTHPSSSALGCTSHLISENAWSRSHSIHHSKDVQPHQVSVDSCCKQSRLHIIFVNFDSQRQRIKFLLIRGTLVIHEPSPLH